LCGRSEGLTSQSGCGCKGPPQAVASLIPWSWPSPSSCAPGWWRGLCEPLRCDRERNRELRELQHHRQQCIQRAPEAAGHQVSSGRHGRAWSCGGTEGTPVPLAVGARVRHRPWHPSSHGRGHHPPLALQDGGVVYASQTSVNGTATVSFESCTITGNSASQVHLRQPAMKRSNDRHGA